LGNFPVGELRFGKKVNREFALIYFDVITGLGLAESILAKPFASFYVFGVSALKI
jgi:hypothetical protein